MAMPFVSTCREPVSEILRGARCSAAFQELSVCFSTLAIVRAVNTGNKSVRCECGYDAQAVDRDELLAELREHARREHRIDLTQEDAVLVLLRAELAEERR